MMNARFDSLMAPLMARLPRPGHPVAILPLKTSVFVATGCLLALGVSHPAQSLEGSAATAQEAATQIAQVYDVAPPPPADATLAPLAVPGVDPVPQAPVSGQQYVVHVSGQSALLLNQVRLVEPTAFQTNYQGRSVIQAGRFNSSQNAQQRASELNAQGIEAQIVEVPAAVPSYYSQSPMPAANTYASNGELPPLPTSALPTVAGNPPTASTPPVPATTVPATPMNTPLPPTPQVAPAENNVEFGQELTYSTPQGAGAYPVNMTPPTNTPEVSARLVNAPYYVVIPTAANNLPELSSQIIQLGTPPESVQQRTSPRGPHVAIGPFADRRLADSWSNFYRQAGFGNSRVYFER